MKLTLELEQKADGRWIGEVPALPGVQVYGATQVQAAVDATVFALSELLDQLGATKLHDVGFQVVIVPATPAVEAR
jgi:hypothetical protein